MKRFQLTPVPARWEDRPCLDTGVELWFGPADDVPPPLQETPEDRRYREETAKAVCGACPFVKRCLEDELQHGIGEQWGVRGGMTAAERQQLIRDRRDRAVAEFMGEVA
ncbi:WhiB family transcriptional regulator [Saccharothrix deserti]|uniref:WhiB family transcriptional regulator n=1 Tax=Saccharothrix deserti TaxID=2593674 RepID=UPI00131AB6EC|nr:WhiB family transcriptional regulator [Saccharothrix deserti]